MNDWTYDGNHVARYGIGYALIPDQVFRNQKSWDANCGIFPAYHCDMTSKKLSQKAFRARLNGAAYGLYGQTPGDPVVVRIPS